VVPTHSAVSFCLDDSDSIFEGLVALCACFDELGGLGAPQSFASSLNGVASDPLAITDGIN
jgi:hypothetical protein